MIEVAKDLRAEGAELKALLEQLNEEDWEKPTPFKGWTPWDVVAHLHWSDRAAVASLKSADEFQAFAENFLKGLEKTPDSKSYTRDFITEKLEGRNLLEVWDEYLTEMCDLLEPSSPDRRCKWFGPDMGVRMFTTARLMETWAHAQDIYDLLGIERKYTDRIKSIAHIGASTFGWTYINRGMDVPENKPYIKLTAPSGQIWEWHEQDANNKVEGLASEFCHVVTQGRNIADTNIKVTGDTATHWMSIAQCFAGPVEDPPPAGARTGGRA